MCGIFLYYGDTQINVIDLFNEFVKIKHRGPDNTSVYINNSIFMGFHRLKINDVDDLGNQPFYKDGVYLICNGEIYNYKQLNETYNLTNKSQSDCETILSLYLYWKNNGFNIECFHDLFDGEFTFILYDMNDKKLLISRDPYGVRPLYWGKNKKGFVFASEQKAIDKLSKYPLQFPPGKLVEIDICTNGLQIWNTGKHYYDYNIIHYNLNTIYYDIKEILSFSVKKRLYGDRPICCLLSGGLDSSLITALTKRLIPCKPLQTFSIGMNNSTDLYWAKKCAEFIGTSHTSITLNKNNFIDHIPQTIKIIESYDVTTVRASVGNLLVSKWIAEKTECKIVLTGEYSDELFSGYLYNKKTPSLLALHQDSVRLLSNIHFFDGLRCDRCISSQGLECRVPFSDPSLIKYVLGVDPSLKDSRDRIEKNILRLAFDEDKLLPHDILWRRKEAFSDAVSSPEDSWHNIIKEWIDNLITDDEYQSQKNKYVHETPRTKEAYYYRKIFHTFYDHAHTIPYQWLPNWCRNIDDPSARELY